MSKPKIYYYQSRHMCEDGKDIYYRVIPESSNIVWERMDWNIHTSYSCLTEKMISFKDSGKEEELNKMVNKYEKEQEEKHRLYVSIREKEFKKEKQKREEQMIKYYNAIERK